MKWELTISKLTFNYSSLKRVLFGYGEMYGAIAKVVVIASKHIRLAMHTL